MEPIVLTKRECVDKGTFDAEQTSVEKQLKAWASLTKETPVEQVVSQVTQEQLLQVLPSISAIENVLSDQPFFISKEASAQATHTVQQIKSKLGALYEAVINGTLGQAIEFRERIKQATDAKELQALEQEFPELRRKLLDQQVQLALLCRQQGIGMQREQRVGQIPVHRPAQVAGHLSEANDVLNTKLNRFSQPSE